MKKRLTETQFQAAIKRLEIGQQTLDIARGVLVEGRPQVAFVKALNLSKGAVSQAVNRVWSVYAISNIPEGYERVSVVLPEHKAYIVKKWGEDARKRRD
ncbi:MAG: transcriptional regulator [Gammaproteobacteria bacterium]|nr:transcriptional regulator [Gammaproteobacteria bacterium]